MTPFRWPSIEQDLILAREVAARKPEKPADWDAVALALSEAFSTDEKVVVLKGRGCRERMERLLLKYRSEDAKGLKRYDFLININVYISWFICLLLSIQREAMWNDNAG